MRDCAHWKHRHCPSVCRSYELTKPSSLFAPRAVHWQLIGAQVRCKRRSCTKRKPCPECALSDHLDVIAKAPTGASVIYTDGRCDDNRKSRVTRTLRSTGAQAYGIAVACLIRTLDNTFVSVLRYSSLPTRTAPLEHRRSSRTDDRHARILPSRGPVLAPLSVRSSATEYFLVKR